MAKVVSARPADQPTAAIGTDVIYRKMFDSFNPGQDGRISHWEVLTRLQRSGLQPDDPRIAEALAGLKAADGSPRQIRFGQFKALAKHNSSLIRRAVEGNLAVPDFSALTSDIDRMYAELIPVKSGAVADYIPQLARVNPEQLAIAVCTVDGKRFSVGDATTMFCLQSVSKMVSYFDGGQTADHGAPGYRRLFLLPPAIQRGVQLPAGADAQLVNTLPRCHSTVRADKNSSAPISGLVRPSRASWAICSSCGVSRSRVSALRWAPSPPWRSAPCGRARRTPPSPSRRTCRARCAAARARRRAPSRRSHSPYSRWARARSGRSRVRPSRSIASWYQPSAASPWLSSARERASSPSPKSVPPAWVVSASRSSAAGAARVLPVRTAASISSGSAHVETHWWASWVACSAAGSASA